LRNLAPTVTADRRRAPTPGVADEVAHGPMAAVRIQDNDIGWTAHFRIDQIHGPAVGFDRIRGDSHGKPCQVPVELVVRLQYVVQLEEVRHSSPGLASESGIGLSVAHHLLQDIRPDPPGPPLNPGLPDSGGVPPNVGRVASARDSLRRSRLMPISLA
jgi:hypothetical protein